MYALEKREEKNTEVKRLKDTLSYQQDKLKTLQEKYENTKESLKNTKLELAKAKELFVELEKNAAGLKQAAKEEFIQSAEFEKYLGQAMDDAVENMIYTMFLKHPKFDYSCLGKGRYRIGRGL